MTQQQDDDDSYISTDDPRPAQLARRPDPAPMARQQPRAAQPLMRAAEPSETRLATTQETGAVMAALCRAQAGYERVVKGRTADAGARGSYTYANLADVAQAVMPSLREQGLFVMQVPCNDVLVTRITHGESGQWIEGAMPLIKPDARGGVQALGSALTYTRRYSLTAMLGIVPEEDDDGAAAQPNAPAPQVQAARRPSPLELRVAELARGDDIAACRAVLISEMQHHGIPERTQALALADFDRRAGAPAASAT